MDGGSDNIVLKYTLLIKNGHIEKAAYGLYDARHVEFLTEAVLKCLMWQMRYINHGEDQLRMDVADFFDVDKRVT
jgi:hypothetical protein